MYVKVTGEVLAVSENVRDGKTYREASCFVESGVRPGVLFLSIPESVHGALDILKGSLRKQGEFTCEFMHGQGWHRFQFVSFAPAVAAARV